MKEHLPTVTHALGTAFDTTLLALALSVFAVLYMSWMLKQEDARWRRSTCSSGRGVRPV